VTDRPRPRFCVFTSAGDYHNVMAWGAGAPDKKWDLVTAFYGDDQASFEELRQISAASFKIEGSKFQNLKQLFGRQPSIFGAYDFILLSDDDIHFTKEKIDELFEIAAAYDLWVCQPSFDPAGRISFPLTAQSGMNLRITNFVEMTCPLFRKDKLVEFLNTYDGQLVGWGMDWWYCNCLNAMENKKFAVIDKIAVINPHNRQRRGEAREIEKLQSNNDRESHWKETAKNLHLEEYEMRNLAYIVDPGLGSNDLNGDVERTDSLVETLLAEYRSTSDELQRVRGDYLRSTWEIDKLNTEQQRLSSELQSAIAELQDIRADHRRATAMATAVRVALDDERVRTEALSYKISNLLKSRSWRITHPMRALKSALDKTCGKTKR
jgi:hypothetical protein